MLIVFQQHCYKDQQQKVKCAASVLILVHESGARDKKRPNFALRVQVNLRDLRRTPQPSHDSGKGVGLAASIFGPCFVTAFQQLYSGLERNDYKTMP